MKRIEAFATIILLSCCMALSAQRNGDPIVEQMNITVSTRKSDKKINEIKKYLTLSSTQEEAIRKAYESYTSYKDSISDNVLDPLLVATLNYENKKKYHETFMSALTESQLNQYIHITYTPEVQAKAIAKVYELKESGRFSVKELDSAQVQIFNYLMLEKSVYVRYRYNYLIQKENIAQFKNSVHNICV